MRRDELFLRDILEAADRISTRLAGVDFSSLAGDEDAQDVILRRLTVIGEAAARLSGELRTRYPGIPWKKAIALRNRLTHAYFGVDWSIVWKTVQEDIPMLRRQIVEILRAEFPD
jgi:uncharacterized protein with HEPN domain